MELGQGSGVKITGSRGVEVCGVVAEIGAVVGVVFFNVLLVRLAHSVVAVKLTIMCVSTVPLHQERTGAVYADIH